MSLDGATAATNDAVRGRGFVRRGPPGHGQPGRGGLRRVQDQRRGDTHQRGRARRAGGHRRLVRRAAAADPPAPIGPGRRRRGTSCTRRRASSATSTGGSSSRPQTLTGDSFFHLSALGEPLEGLNLCGAGRVVCLIDPVGDVYACPFVIDRQFLAGNVRQPGGFAAVWRESALFASLREPQSAGACASCGSYDACQGGCMAAKFFTGLPLDGPDPECVHGHGETALAALRRRGRPPHLGPGPLQGPTRRHARPGAAPRSASGCRRPPERWNWAAPPGPRWTQRGRRAVLAVPLGSLEQHGPHLPLDTDTRIAMAVAAGAAAGRLDLAVAPALAYGASGEHAGFPGTLSLGHDALTGLLVELVRSARVVVRRRACSSAPTAATRRRSRRRAGAASPRATTCWCGGVAPAAADAHAGRTETSLMLAIDAPVGAARLRRARRTEPLERAAAAPARRRGAPGIVQRRAGRPRGCERRGGAPRSSRP